MDLKIIEPIKNHLKEFKTVDEFNLYYSKHKEDIDSMTTHKLNKLYHIDGYRITKIKGKLCLKKFNGKIKSSQKVDQTLNPKGLKETDSTDEENLRQIIDEHSEEIKKLKTALNDIINFLNEYSNQEQMCVSTCPINI